MSESPAPAEEAVPAAPGAGGSAAIQARYGRTAGRRRRDRWLLVAAGGILVVAAAAWLGWGGWRGLLGLTGDSSQVTATAGSTEVTDAAHVRISFTVEAPVNTRVACAIEAQDVNFGIAGWKVIVLPPSDKQTRSLTTVVRSVTPSVSADVSSCWVPTH